MENQITTLTFFKYKGIYNKVWAFCMMLYMHLPLRKTSGQSFYKLLGTGKENFNPMPDWSEYAVLQVWDNEHYAEAYFQQSKSFKTYQRHTIYQYTVFLKNVKSKGLWSGKSPFVPALNIDPTIDALAVITRATIKLSKLFVFWKFVPKSQKGVQNNKSLLFTRGIGEVPALQMSTFSIWKSEEALHEFAYKSRGHVKAIQKTKAIDWYKEELFARFQPYKTIGDWQDKPL